MDPLVVMHRSGKAQLELIVWGDWYTVIGVREYRDILLDQKPIDDEDANYRSYRIRCNSTEELMRAAEAFRKAKLLCAIGMRFISDDGNVIVSAISGSGYGTDEPYCSVEFKESELKAKRAIQQAIQILKEALQ